MSIRICFVYPWATFGGVERILLNRAIAFKKMANYISMDLFFLHDAGGIKLLQEAINEYHLNDMVRIVPSLDTNRYELILIIDCPEAIDYCRSHRLKYIVECHTAYPQNRAYLRNIAHNESLICVPSVSFAKVIEKEVNLPLSRIHVLRNFVPWDIELDMQVEQLQIPQWSRIPILFFGRMDKLKDPLTLMRAFSLIEAHYPGEFMLLFCGPETSDINMEIELINQGIRGFSVILPVIPFSRTNDFLKKIAVAGGIFVSPSKGESFGLSAAESIACGLPVLLSDIEPHSFLCDGDKSFLFPVDNAVELSKRILWLHQNMSLAYEKINHFRLRLSGQAFINDWLALEKTIGLT